MKACSTIAPDWYPAILPTTLDVQRLLGLDFAFSLALRFVFTIVIQDCAFLTYAAFLMKQTKARPGIEVLAQRLKKDDRTVRRYIRKYPQLAEVMPIVKRGKYIAIAPPRDPAELDRWVAEIQRVVAGKTRTRQPANKYADVIYQLLGGNDLRRERDLRILACAMAFKRAQRRISDQRWSTLDEDSFSQEPEYKVDESRWGDLADWQSNVRKCCAAARIISARYNCSVFRTMDHWRAFLLQEREQNQKAGLPGPDIDIELGLIENLWPDTEQIDTAAKVFDRQWQVETLTKAVFELVQNGRPVTATRVSRLLFRNQVHEMEWLASQVCPAKVRVNANHAPPAWNEVQCKRGISVREYHNRYCDKDIARAKKAAIQAGGYKIKDEKDCDGMNERNKDGTKNRNKRFIILDERGKPITTIADIHRKRSFR
ncbi:MAG TPA: hypothetical protein PKW32_09820 [Verrucomicrobiota bacterium]|nr:hypothetical protein [Verrucomicrobiota bacterium]